MLAMLVAGARVLRDPPALHRRRAQARRCRAARSSRRGRGTGRPCWCPVDEINRAVLRTVDYARTISPNVTALHVTDDLEEGQRAARGVGGGGARRTAGASSTRRTARSWRRCSRTSTRSTSADPGQYVTVVLPEFRTRVAVAALAPQPVGAPPARTRCSTGPTPSSSRCRTTSAAAGGRAEPDAGRERPRQSGDGACALVSREPTRGALR